MMSEAPGTGTSEPAHKRIRVPACKTIPQLAEGAQPELSPGFAKAVIAAVNGMAVGGGRWAVRSTC
jgi:hypothetical protein